ncbi:MAG TPA: pimeloyl-ACP methyl esterase BioG family protein [Bacteroidales bacterium]|nr:pimeloyl-ACP methyl esterase BioG family protein [Bacteroidales bacterium]
MKTYIRRREKNNKLVVLYGGWGSDENTYLPLCNDEFDFIMFYNYSADEALILPEMKTYDRIIVIAFSLGVWAAEYLSGKTNIKADLAIAVNGTPLPADEKYGIPLNIFEGTLNNLTEESIGKFYLRMFGNKRSFVANAERMPHRTLKSLLDELRWLYNRIMEQKEPGFKWDYAVTSENDRVYPSKNLESYWSLHQDTTQIKLPVPHYFFHNWNSFMEFISFVENYQTLSMKEKKSILKKLKYL